MSTTFMRLHTFALIFLSLLFLFAVSCTKLGIEINGLSITPESLYMTVGEQATVAPVIEPENATNQKVYFTSDDDAVATVSQSGVVTAVAPGTTLVTVTTDDGGLKAQCDVHVTLAGAK